MAWRAVCDCGWKGKPQRRRDVADYDKRVHEHVHLMVAKAPRMSAETARRVAVLFGLRVPS